MSKRENPAYTARVHAVMNDMPRTKPFQVSTVLKKHRMSRALGTILQNEGYLEKVGKLRRWTGPEGPVDEVAAQLITDALRNYHRESNERNDKRRMNEREVQHRTSYRKRTDRDAVTWVRRWRLWKFRITVERLP